MIPAKHLRGAPHISDTHRGCAGDSPELPEAVNLHRTGKRQQNISRGIHGMRQKSRRHQKYDFYKKDDLSPVKQAVFFIQLTYPLRHIHASDKCQNGKQIPYGALPVSCRQVLSQQHDIACLGIGKYLSSAIIRVSVLESSGQSQNNPKRQRFRHLPFTVCHPIGYPSCHISLPFVMSCRFGVIIPHFPSLCHKKFPHCPGNSAGG